MKWEKTLETLGATGYLAPKSKIFDVKFIIHFRWNANSVNDEFSKVKCWGYINEFVFSLTFFCSS